MVFTPKKLFQKGVIKSFKIMQRPAFPTQQDLVSACIEFCEAADDNVVYEENFWSFEMMEELVEGYPEETFKIIKLILNTNVSNDVLGCLAAGPLEELIRVHGVKMIDAKEAEAVSNIEFNKALGGVWESDIIPEIWKRIIAVRKIVW